MKRGSSNIIPFVDRGDLVETGDLCCFVQSRRIVEGLHCLGLPLPPCCCICQPKVSSRSAWGQNLPFPVSLFFFGAIFPLECRLYFYQQFRVCVWEFALARAGARRIHTLPKTHPVERPPPGTSPRAAQKTGSSPSGSMFWVGSMMPARDRVVAYAGSCCRDGGHRG
jgi:hypothetical protein